MLKTRLPRKTAIAIRRHEGGFVVDGPGYYIWDEDPNEVLRMARALERGGINVNTTARFLIVRNDSGEGRVSS